MARSTVKKQAIWWAVDPFHDDNFFHEHAINVLIPFARALATVIHPVIFIDQYRAAESEADATLESLKATAEKRLEVVLKKAPRNLFASRVFLSHEPGDAATLRDQVGAISAEALKHSALFVALNSHAHRGFKRLYMGSFAETFMLHSNVSMLIINPSCVVSFKLRHAVFPTDFSSESIKACTKFQAMCLKLKTSLSIVHKLPWWLSASVSNPQLKADAESQKQESARALEKLETKANGLGLKAEGVLLTNNAKSESPAASILKFSRDKHADLIAIAAQSGPVMTTLLGATSRSVVREAHCPVLVYRAPPAK